MEINIRTSIKPWGQIRESYSFPEKVELIPTPQDYPSIRHAVYSAKF